MRSSSWFALGSLLLACSSQPVDVVSAPSPEIPAACVTDEDCDDGLVCSGLERCLDGRCWSGRPPRCADDDPCTRDLCLEPLGCSYLPMCDMDAGGEGDAAQASDGRAEQTWRDAEAGAPDSGSRFSPRLPAYCDPTSTIVDDVRVSEQTTLEQLAGVRCILGRLDVGGIAIRSLASLSALRWVGGEVRVHDAPALSSFAGLDALERVEGPLSLLNVGSAPSLEPLNALVDVAGPLLISGAQATRLGGFAALTHVGGELRLELPLQNIESAFPRLERVDGKLDLFSTAFVTFDGFPALRELAGDLQLPNGVAALRGFRTLRALRGKLVVPKEITQLAAFDALESVGELELTVTKLRVLDGFRALRQISGPLRISGPQLESISGFDQLETVGSLALGAAPKLASLSAFRNLARTRSLLVSQTLLTALPFERLASCDTLGLSANPELRDASALVQVADVSSLTLHGSSALRSLSVGVRPEMQLLALSENLALTDLSLRGLTRFLSGIAIYANPNLSRCQVDQLAAKAKQDARSELCCNQGCARCDGERCVEAGSFASGQSTRVSYLDIGLGTELRSLVNIESADFVTVGNYEGALTPLANLRSVEHDFDLQHGSTLADLSLFSALESVGRDLHLIFPRRLTSLSGLSALRSVGGTLSIENAPELRDLSLPQLRTLGDGASIWGAPKLNQCHADALRQQLGAPDAGAGSVSASVARCAGTCAGAVCQ
jgi:hypothetical protein